MENQLVALLPRILEIDFKFSSIVQMNRIV